MRTIDQSSAFKRDWKREKANPRHRRDLDELVTAVLKLLIADESLPIRNRDHTLSGDWTGCRECHVKPDLLLIYSLPGKTTLRLLRLGSHSELFG